MECMWIEICQIKSNLEVSKRDFISGMNVWIERPHLLNRKLSAVEALHSWNFSQQDCILPVDLDILLESGHFSYEETMKLIETMHLDEQGIQDSDKCIDESSITLLVRKLIPKNLGKFKEVLEVVVFDYALGCATFYSNKKDLWNSKITVLFPYRVKLLANGLTLEAYKTRTQTCTTDLLSEEWLKGTVLPKIISWSQNSPKTKGVSSLKLVPARLYAQNYFHLKTKYGKYFTQIWPECTDPLKYVYEDIAIAAYLVTIWEEERKLLNLDNKQSFIDIGCGNGLLVHILSSEGHLGVGLDVRRRKIWDLYGPGTTLLEKAVEPTGEVRFPDYDWIIGNHSDELTPWIPVIAARSSYNTRVFLLPCCFYTFNGKYERNNCQITQYQSYLNFIDELCKIMGFNVSQDKLRIPSTKRVCFVCHSRNYEEKDEKEVDHLRKVFIIKKSRKYMECNSLKAEDTRNKNAAAANMQQVISTQNISSLLEFKPRDSVETVRNCSQLDKIFLNETVINVMNILLKTENYVYIECSGNAIHWNCGGHMNIVDVVKLLDSNALKNMKSQCGGIQTFLRNYKSVFLVQNGKVQLRIPSVDPDWNPKSKKSKCGSRAASWHKHKCHFYHHHPQGCPLNADVCLFSHEFE